MFTSRTENVCCFACWSKCPDNSVIVNKGVFLPSSIQKNVLSVVQTNSISVCHSTQQEISCRCASTSWSYGLERGHLFTTMRLFWLAHISTISPDFTSSQLNADVFWPQGDHSCSLKFLTGVVPWLTVSAHGWTERISLVVQLTYLALHMRVPPQPKDPESSLLEGCPASTPRGIFFSKDHTKDVFKNSFPVLFKKAGDLWMMLWSFSLVFARFL